MEAKRISNGYTGRMTWAVIVPHALGDYVVESGFSTKRDALAYIANCVKP